MITAVGLSLIVAGVAWWTAVAHDVRGRWR